MASTRPATAAHPGGGDAADGRHVPCRHANSWVVYFAVDDTDAIAARAAELGGTVVVPPTDIPVGRFATISDPQGTAFSVIKMAASAVT